jgi:Putative auto-transporter adhesin, head GIN domain
MKRLLAIAACACAAPSAALAATHTYETGAFEAVSVASGVEADITLGPNRSVRADTKADNFDALRITVNGNVLRIERARGGIFGWFGSRPNFQVHIVTPALHSLTASSGSDVTTRGSVEGNFSVTASSGSDVDVSLVRGGNVKADASSGSEISIAGSCISLEVGASSGSDVDADELSCESVSVQASSGSDVSIKATKSVKGKASSGSDVRIKGKPPAVQVEKSSGAKVVVRD